MGERLNDQFVSRLWPLGEWRDEELRSRFARKLGTVGWAIGLIAMTASVSLMLIRTHMRMILMVMVAVVASMTLHHGAMAAAPAAHDHAQLHVEHEVEDAACTQECSVPSHSIPACCGMGLCLSGVPVIIQIEEFPLQRNSTSTLNCGLRAQSMSGRIDRPPKISDRDEL